MIDTKKEDSNATKHVENRLASECEKLDKNDERSFADFGLVSATNWEKIKNMTDEEIDYSNLPEVSMEMFAKGIVRRGLKTPTRKAQITLRIDDDVLEFFREQGSGYQTKINALLRAYMEEHVA